MSVLFANGVRTSLTASVGTGDTSIAVGAATGMPAAGGGDYFMLRLTSVNTMAYEIVKVTAISGTTLTVVRAQEGTTALAFVSGDRAELRLTAGTLDAIRDELQVNIDAVEQIATDALALANSALTTANATAADLAGKFPVQTADIADEAVTEDKLNASVAGDGLTGGAGTPLALDYDADIFEIDGSGQLTIKDGGILPAQLNGQLFTQYAGTGGDGATGTTALFTGTIPFAGVHGNDGAPCRWVNVTLTNNHTTQRANVKVRIGATLNYYLGTGSDQGLVLFDLDIQAAGLLGADKVYQGLTFLVPNGQRWMLEKGGTDGTPDCTIHKYLDMR